MKMFLTALVATTLIGSYTSHVAFAEDDTVKEKTVEAAHDTSRAVKKGARKASDEVCEMVNGKMKCVGKKIKHAAQNAGDKAHDMAD